MTLLLRESSWQEILFAWIGIAAHRHKLQKNMSYLRGLESNETTKWIVTIKKLVELIKATES